MIKKTRYTLITAEILGFFLIIIGILGMVTQMRVFFVAFFILFFMIIIVIAIFAVLLTLAVKEVKGVGKTQIKFKYDKKASQKRKGA
jgi:membrane protein implicated in regulation of membrane protease activity